MSGSPLIGVPMQMLDPRPDYMPRSWVVGEPYVAAIVAAGAIPWLIPALDADGDALRTVYERLDGLCLLGGVDVDPSHYGEVREPYCGRVDAARDRMELALARWALSDDVPILAICRGVQVLNVAAGGSLYQDLSVQFPTADKHDYFVETGMYARNLRAHEVWIEAGSRLERIVGTGVLEVNSLHHQAIKDVAPELTPSAIAPDGLVEAVEVVGASFALGVQWHPEDLAGEDPTMQALFDALAAAARPRVQTAEPAVPGDGSAASAPGTGIVATKEDGGERWEREI